MADTLEIIAKLQAALAPAARNPQPREHGGYQYLDCIPRIECADGFEMSVQTGPTHYCQPRDGVGPWYTVEVGFPSARVEAFMPFIDGGDSDPTDTVYGYVPIEVVAQAIADHGGFKSEAAQ